MMTDRTTAGAMLAGRVRAIVWVAEMMPSGFGHEGTLERLREVLAEYDAACAEEEEA